MGYKATKAQGSTLVNLGIRYKVSSEKGTITNPTANFYCYSCKVTDSTSGWATLTSSSLKQTKQVIEPEYYETNTSFEYDGSQPQIELSLTTLRFDLMGKWEFNIPVKP